MTSFTLRRTTSENSDFIHLISLLDHDLAIRDGNEHAFYAQFNQIALIQHVVVVYEKEQAVACGAIKKWSDTETEIKRMFVLPELRGKRVAVRVLDELEKWASELGFQACVLETGKKQVEALQLYQRQGYAITPNYGQYIGVENSVCMKKAL